jgi:membrane-associated protease RseP (regulator of RpoE activity)
MKKVIKSLFITAVFAIAATASESEIFGGIGISVWTGKEGAKIAAVMPKSPAENVGLQIGDLIVSANGNELSAVEPGLQVSLIRGEAGTTVNLVVDRNGNTFSVSAKRAELSVQGMEAEEISNWYGKSQGLTGEELGHLANQKISEGYELLAVMQYGALVANSAENLNANAIQQISIKKAEQVQLPETKPVDLTLASKNASLVNAKGARINKQGNVRLYKTLK